MYLFTTRAARVCKLAAVVRLNTSGDIPKKDDCTFYKVARRPCRLLRIRVNKPLARRFVNHCVLKKARPFFVGRDNAFVTFARDVFYVHLHFYAEHLRRVIRLRNIAVVFAGGAEFVLH